MINLLPSDQRKAIIYARRNTKLRRWIVGLVAVLVGVGVLLGAGQLLIVNATSRYETQVADGQASLKAQNLEQTQAKVQDLSNNLKLIIQVLSQEVLFSKLMQQIGSVMPDGSVLSTIDLTKIQGGIDLTAQAKDYNTATQVQVNLQDPNNKLFDKVDLVQVTCGSSKEGPYPCKVTLRALFSKNNSYLFINNKPGGKS